MSHIINRLSRVKASGFNIGHACGIGFMYFGGTVETTDFGIPFFFTLYSSIKKLIKY